MKYLFIALTALLLSGCDRRNHIEMPVITKALEVCAKINSDLKDIRFMSGGTNFTQTEWNVDVTCTNEYRASFIIVTGETRELN